MSDDKVNKYCIDRIALSGQMQSLVPVDSSALEPLIANALVPSQSVMIFSDVRATKQAAELEAVKADITATASNHEGHAAQDPPRGYIDRCTCVLFGMFLLFLLNFRTSL